jgi:two-component system, NtrC family, sensor histidine kinase HydH
VAGLVLPISILHYFTPHFENIHHLIYRELYLLPIFLASFWFGLRGGILCSLAVTAIYLPLSFWGSEPEVSLVANVLQMLVFNLFAVTLGIMRDRDIGRQKAQARLSSLAAMGQAVSSIAHDLKSPLMAIGGFATQVRRKLNDEDSSAQKLDIVIAQAARMESMVKDMLAFARPLELNRQEADLNSLLKQVVEVAKAAAAEKACCITVELEGSAPKLKLDQDRMQQALLNLLNNGIEAMPPDGTLRITTKNGLGKVEIEVSDQGPGIAPENQSKLFTPFVTTKKGGTGLGLSTAKKIVEAHGGSLSLKDSSPEGTTFLIRLPLVGSTPVDNAYAMTKAARDFERYE